MKRRTLIGISNHLLLVRPTFLGRFLILFNQPHNMAHVHQFVGHASSHRRGKSKEGDDLYRTQLNFKTRIGARAVLEDNTNVTFDTIVQSGAVMIVRYDLNTPNTMHLEHLSLGDYDVAANDLVRMRTGEAAIS